MGFHFETNKCVVKHVNIKGVLKRINENLFLWCFCTKQASSVVIQYSERMKNIQSQRCQTQQ